MHTTLAFADSYAFLSRPYHPVATSNILKKMTDPNLPTMRTRINGLALTLAEKTWAQDKLTANPDLATTWTPETDVSLTAFIKQSAIQSTPPDESQTSQAVAFSREEFDQLKKTVNTQASETTPLSKKISYNTGLLRHPGKRFSARSHVRDILEVSLLLCEEIEKAFDCLEPKVCFVWLNPNIHLVVLNIDALKDTPQRERRDQPGLNTLIKSCCLGRIVLMNNDYM
ncbi:hypothetical protein PROFUN_16399 [Planoprotostelium fungivorum]|uniref:Uncharacterized protein n=1 Tax=Planoprotostelium fungivorum TaxID=1890364 RepID=A0A2P6MQY5_9EUKA|nr:hypothetical protein PROFUN_16399 [Planoprotostelium fungivorum]